MRFMFAAFRLRIGFLTVIGCMLMLTPLVVSAQSTKTSKPAVALGTPWQTASIAPASVPAAAYRVFLPIVHRPVQTTEMSYPAPDAPPNTEQQGDRFEPDNSRQQAAPLAVGEVQSRSFGTENDEDWVQVTLNSRTTYRFATSNLGSAADTVLELYDQNNGARLAADDDGGNGLASSLVYTFDQQGTYYVKVSQYDNRGGPTGYTYDLALERMPDQQPTPQPPTAQPQPPTAQPQPPTAQPQLPTAQPQPPTAQPQPPTAQPQPPENDFAAAIVELTNRERAAHGCPALTANSQLNNAALGHSQDMAQRDFFSHRNPDGASPGDRIAQASYASRGWAENIAAGFRTPEQVVTQWMASSGHRRNILNCSMQEIGVGYFHQPNDDGDVRYRHYWTQVFGIPR